MRRVGAAVSERAGSDAVSGARDPERHTLDSAHISD